MILGDSLKTMKSQFRCFIIQNSGIELQAEPNLPSLPCKSNVCFLQFPTLVLNTTTHNLLGLDTRYFGSHTGRVWDHTLLRHMHETKLQIYDVKYFPL